MVLLVLWIQELSRLDCGAGTFKVQRINVVVGNGSTIKTTNFWEDTSLNLSHNNWIGTILAALCNLQIFSPLNSSRNHLMGTMPSVQKDYSCCTRWQSGSLRRNIWAAYTRMRCCFFVYSKINSWVKICIPIVGLVALFILSWCLILQ